MTEIDLDALADAYNRGLDAEKAGDTAAAVSAYHSALALDPDDRGGVSVRLAALKQGDVPPRAPPAYVETLFDQTAQRFDEILVGQLGYSVPMMLAPLLAAHGVDRIGRLLDLGCGTGLTGECLADITDHATGCDLSEGMTEIAFDRGVYDDLYIGDAVALVEGWDEAPFDVIAATDVLPYLGDVDPLLAGVAARLVPGGHFVFSTETLAPADFDGHGYTVGPGQRFAHSEAHVRNRLAAHAMTVLAFDPISVREENGVPVPGHLVLARR